MPDYPSSVLRNKGCPLEVNVVGDDGNVILANEEPVKTTVYLRFKARHCAAIEEKYRRLEIIEDQAIFDNSDPTKDAADRPLIGYTQVPRTYQGVEGWQQSLNAYPYETVLWTLGLVLEITEDQAAEMIPAEGIQHASIALAGAWALANGVDPDDVGKLLAAGREKVAQATAAIREQMAQSLGAPVEDESPSDTPGETGSLPGFETPTPEDSAEPLMSSGT